MKETVECTWLVHTLHTDLKKCYGFWSDLRSTVKAKIAFSDRWDLSSCIGRLDIFQIMRF